MTEQKGIELAHAAAMPAPQGGALPTGLEWQALERMATTLADSDLVPYQLKRKPADIAVILLAAREYGIPPIMALSKLPVVNGKPAPMGELMVALVLRAGHRISARFLNPDGTVYKSGPLTRDHYGEATYRRRDWTDDEALQFSISEAVTAGLVTINRDGTAHARDSKDRPTPWEQYTPNMCRWRAVANACRLAFADVLMGLSYLPEELGAVVDADGAPIMGEVVGEAPRTRTTSARPLEERTAQEAADKLAEQPWPPHVLDAVTATAEEGGYLDLQVEYQGGRMAFRDAIEANRRREDVVEAETVEEPIIRDDQDKPLEADAQGAPEEPASAPPAAEEPPPGPSAPTEAGEDPQDAAHDLAREALNAGTVEEVQAIYRAAGMELRTLNVISVVNDDDLATLGAPPDLDRILLGGLLYEVGQYVKRHGCAVHDLGLGGGDAPSADSVDWWAPGTSANPGQA